MNNFFLKSATAPILVVSLIPAPINAADEPYLEKDSIYQFALDPSSLGEPLIDQSPGFIYSTLGLPDDIKISKDNAWWDIDQEIIPVEIIYPEVFIVASFHRIVYFNPELRKMSKIPYREIRNVESFYIKKPGAILLYGIHAGMPSKSLLAILGRPLFGNWSEESRLRKWEYEASTLRKKDLSNDLRESVEIDENRNIRKISWHKVPWH